MTFAKPPPTSATYRHCGIRGAWLALALALLANVSWARDAEIVALIGKGERMEGLGMQWKPAVVKQELNSGWFVRTLDQSQMGLLFSDRTQIRLGQNSQLQIKTVAESKEWQQTSLKLHSGRAWSQARPESGGASAPPRVVMETPTTTMSIRGTDWDVSVGPDGRTELAVLSGVVSMENEFGRVSVGKGEGAVAEPGKAPTKFQLVNPAERVQWVNAWRPQPLRWVPQAQGVTAEALRQIEAGRYREALDRLAGTSPENAAAALLMADLHLFSGEAARAVAVLGPHAQNGLGNPQASALLARALIVQDKIGDARSLLQAARKGYPDHVELLLAAGHLAVLDGSAPEARAAFAAAIARAPENGEAWYGAGLVEAERENVGIARHLLAQAAAKDPAASRYPAEQGALEAFAGSLIAAGQAFDKALAIADDDYVALAGRGILRLKAGDARAALEDFLRAGVIEPRYARAWLYSGVAFYQLGDTRRAVEAFRKTAELDPRDPLPHVMLGLIAADQLDLGHAVDAARDAQERMPYLKSLNQVLNNQKGSANVGSALAAFGLDEWARYYATAAYSPWWAGSHLFLADRHTPGYNKNSELFKGFMTDPTVFGASQRQSSLVPEPGHHGRADLFLEQGNWRQNALIGTANGLVTAPIPLAYFVSGDLSDGRSRLTADAADGTNLTLGLGMRPNHALGVFMFGTDTHIRGELNNPTLPKDPLSIDDSRLDLGVNVKLDGNNQIWLKSGSGRQSNLIRGRVATPALVPLDRFFFGVAQDDMQFRHAFAPADGTWLSWGYEDSRQEKQAYFDLQFSPTTKLAISELGDLHSRDAYFVARLPFADALRAELGAFGQRTSNHQRAETRLNSRVLGTPINNPREFAETNWRGGLQWQFGPRSSITGVAQNWRRPASAGSLAPIDTLGIAVNDRLTTNGGRYSRNRIQIDHEATSTTFVQGFVDRENVTNITSPLTAVVPDLQLTELESLRNRRDAFTVQPELEKAPQFLEGRVNSHGVAVNHRLGHDHTLSLRYRRADARQTGIRDGLHIPYVPRDYLRLASHWSLPQRWLVGANATWRSERFRDESNTAAQRLNAGWIFGLTTYWESADKRWVAQAILDNLRRDRSSSDDRASKLILRASYLF